MKHPENRGDRNPLASKRIKRQMRQNILGPKKKSTAARSRTEVDLPGQPKPETPQPPNQPAQPNPGDPVPLRS
jgi:hypothetical protein